MFAPFRTVKNAARYYHRHGFSKTMERSKLAIKRECVRPCIARFVGMAGNRWRLDGCVFLLDSPLVPGYTKCFVVEGIYELEMRRLIKKHLLRERPVIELGASSGVVSCITNSLLQDPSQHLVVEANPELLSLLERNRNGNDCQFSVRHAAVAYGADTIPFFIHKKAGGGSVHWPSDQQVIVPTASLTCLLKETGFHRINLIVDIEGAEIALIENESDVLRHYVEMLFIEMHPGPVPKKTVEDALQCLCKAGFALMRKEADVFVFKNTAHVSVVNAVHELARQPFTKEEEEAYAEALLVGHRQCHPYYKHVIRRFAPARARRCLQSLHDGGKRLLAYVEEARVQLKDYKVIQFSHLIRSLRPRVIYEFGAGGSTCLFAELLQENHRKYGIKGELHSFEQSEDYYQRMLSAFPEDLRPYVTWHFCETQYAWREPYRALSYKKPHLDHPVVDLVYVDGPDHIYGMEHFTEYPFFNSDLIDLVDAGVTVHCAVNDVRWFNKPFFEHFLSSSHDCDLCLASKSFIIRPR